MSLKDAIRAMLEATDPRIRKMAELAEEGQAAVDRGDYEAAHEVLLRQRAHAVDTGASAHVVAMIDSAIRSSAETVVSDNVYARTFADGRTEFSALGVVRFVYELPAEDAWPSDAKRRARMWPRVEQFQRYIDGKIAVAQALGASTDLATVLSKAVDIERVRAAIRTSRDPIEAVLAAAKGLVH